MIIDARLHLRVVSSILAHTVVKISARTESSHAISKFPQKLVTRGGAAPVGVIVAGTKWHSLATHNRFHDRLRYQ
jgi:hypothetical protein